MAWKQPIDTDIYLWFGEDHLARDLFLHLLIRARNEDMKYPEHYKGKPYLLKRGQTIFGRNEYAKKLRCAPSSVRKSLIRLEKVFSKVTSESSPDYTVITILKYDELVSMEQAKEQAGDKQVTSRGQAGNTNKSDKSGKSGKSGKKKEKKIYAENSIEFQLALFEINCIRKTYPDLEFSNGNLQKISDMNNKLMRIDHYHPDVIKQVCEWVSNHSNGSFSWADQFQSPLKLRRNDKDGRKFISRWQAEMRKSQEIDDGVVI